ncbi:MAG: anti-sigma factor [Chloroflexota bacterium]|nr:anti-sigma factor [Chloroflexota bacterium]
MVEKDIGRTHEEFQELLAAAAFGTLTDDEWASLRGHLDGCAECRAELSDFQFIAAALPLTLDELQPEPQLRNRILAMVQHEHRSTEPPTATAPPVMRGMPDDMPESHEVQGAPPPMSRLEPRPAPAAAPTPIRRGHLWATAALVLLSLLAGAAVGRFMLADEPDPEPDDETIAMQFSTPIPNVQGDLMYMPEEQIFKLSMENMPAAPAEHVYQVWLIGESGPVSCGVMDSSEFAVAADRAQYNALAITVEPAPLGSPRPTSDPIMTAPFTGGETNET